MLPVTAAIGVTIAIRSRDTVIGERRLRGTVAAMMPNIVVVLNLKSCLASFSSTKVYVVVFKLVMPSTTLHVSRGLLILERVLSGRVSCLQGE